MKSYLLRNENVKRHMIKAMEGFSVSEDSPLIITIEQFRGRPREGQRKHMFYILGEISKHTGISKPELHEYCKSEFIGIRDDGKPMSTSTLRSAEEYDAYIDQIVAWAAVEHGFQI